MVSTLVPVAVSAGLPVDLVGSAEEAVALEEAVPPGDGNVWHHSHNHF